MISYIIYEKEEQAWPRVKSGGRETTGFGQLSYRNFHNDNHNHDILIMLDLSYKAISANLKHIKDIGGLCGGVGLGLSRASKSWNPMRWLRAAREASKILNRISYEIQTGEYK